MSGHLQIFLIFFCIFLLFFITIWVKKRKFSLRYALIWYFFACLMLFSSLFPNLLKPIAQFLGFEVVSNMVFFFGCALLLMIAFYLTSIVSSLKEKTTRLAQEIAILKDDSYEK